MLHLWCFFVFFREGRQGYADGWGTVGSGTGGMADGRIRKLYL